MVQDKKLRAKTTSLIDVMNFNTGHSAQTRNDQFSAVSCFKKTSVEQGQTFRLIGLKCPADYILKRVQVFDVNCISTYVTRQSFTVNLSLCGMAIIYLITVIVNKDLLLLLLLLLSMLEFSCQVDSASFTLLAS